MYVVCMREPEYPLVEFKMRSNMFYCVFSWFYPKIATPPTICYTIQKTQISTYVRTQISLQMD